MKTLLLLWVLSNGTDVTTTELAVQSGKGYESNPLLKNTFVRLSLHAGMTVSGGVLIKKVHPKHPKLTKVATLVVSGVYIGASIHNYKVWSKE